MALGAGSVTPMQMATAYAVFANGGYRVNPLLITKITDQQGQALVDEASRRCRTSRCAPIDARNAFIMNSLLQEITRSGTAARAQRDAQAAPTSTARPAPPTTRIDTWFAGYQPSSSAVVWMGYDNPRKLGDRETGGGLSLPVWIDFMETALKGVPVKEPTAPEGVVNVGGEWYYEEYARGARREQRRPRGQAADRSRRRRPRKSATASSTCSGAAAVAASAGTASKTSSGWPACCAGVARQSSKNSPPLVSIQRRRDPAVVEAARARRQPDLVQRRLHVHDDLAAVREGELEHAAGALVVDVDDVVLQPAVDRRLDARRARRACAASYSASVRRVGCGRASRSWSIESRACCSAIAV